MIVTRSLAPWLPADASLLCQNIVRRAMCDLGITEMPPGSNRSGRIDEYVQAVGAPLGSYWCAAALAAWWREAGAGIPGAAAGACETWLQWGKAAGRFSSTPKEGYAVLYSFAGDGHADHCGVVIRVAPIPLTIEGNTSLAGYSRNGVAVDLKVLNAARVLGYIAPALLTH